MLQERTGGRTDPRENRSSDETTPAMVQRNPSKRLLGVALYPARLAIFVENYSTRTNEPTCIDELYVRLRSKGLPGTVRLLVVALSDDDAVSWALKINRRWNRHLLRTTAYQKVGKDEEGRATFAADVGRISLHTSFHLSVFLMLPRPLPVRRYAFTRCWTNAGNASNVSFRTAPRTSTGTRW